jgi:hypothetical protein
MQQALTQSDDTLPLACRESTSLLDGSEES